MNEKNVNKIDVFVCKVCKVETILDINTSLDYIKIKNYYGCASHKLCKCPECGCIFDEDYIDKWIDKRIVCPHDGCEEIVNPKWLVKNKVNEDRIYHIHCEICDQWLKDGKEPYVKQNYIGQCLSSYHYECKPEWDPRSR